MQDVFAIDDRVIDGVPTLAVSGEIDVSTAPALRDRLVALALEGPVTVVVDLSEVTFLDSTALGVLVSALKRLREDGGGLRLVVASGSVARVLEITGLAEVFPIFESLALAVTQ